jgi:hypothetical protein
LVFVRGQNIMATVVAPWAGWTVMMATCMSVLSAEKYARAIPGVLDVPNATQAGF